MITKATPADAGCWIDGHWGQYAVSRSILIALMHGFDDTELVELANRHLDECTHPGNDNHLTVDDHEAISWGADRVEAWMNDNVAPDGYSFGWWEGEFFLSSTEWWEEA